MMRWIVGLALFVNCFVAGCGSKAKEIAPESATAGQPIGDTAATQRGMEESLKHMPPNVRARMEAQMGGADKVKQRATAK